MQRDKKLKLNYSAAVELALCRAYCVAITRCRDRPDNHPWNRVWKLHKVLSALRSVIRF